MSTRTHVVWSVVAELLSFCNSVKVQVNHFKSVKQTYIETIQSFNFNISNHKSARLR